MGCLAVFKPVILTHHPWQTSHNFTSISVSPNLSTTCGYRITTRVQDLFGSRRQDHNHLICYNQYNPSSSSSSMDNEQQPPQDAILKVLSGISKGEGRIGRATTMVLGGTMADDSTHDRLSLTKMSDFYPAARGFTAIGSGGDDFVQSMVVAVESVVQHPIPQGKVKQKLSSGGKYVSVNIGPVQIVSSKQVCSQS
ncbi:hypothetical protein M8C21_017874 [Ambrosia artemisiifolia]|uniref:Uncharacterized protein n=1 Tax=Ambrosia artemisiifolia TaxID=4212 RepID=A0AAD5C7Q2_AMBAR|nr:hypothetical protein M8C21_017874 [Ambrosia artemisiifolia]